MSRERRAPGARFPTRPRCERRSGGSYAGAVHLDLIAIVVGEYDPAIDFFVGALGFESAPTAKNRKKHASTLTIVWLQDDYALPISPACMNAIKEIDWDSHAFDFDF